MEKRHFPLAMPNKSMQVKIDINTLPKWKCGECGRTDFTIVSEVRIPPMLLRGGDVPDFIIMQHTIRCVSCGHDEKIEDVAAAIKSGKDTISSNGDLSTGENV